MLTSNNVCVNGFSEVVDRGNQMEEKEREI